MRRAARFTAVMVSALALVAATETLTSPPAGAALATTSVTKVTTQGRLGGAVAVYGGTVLAATQGAVDVFVRTGGGWARQAQLTPSDAQTSGFGNSVAIAGDVAIVGNQTAYAPYNQQLAGAAYIFRRLPDQTWVQEAELQIDVAGLRFGSSVATSSEDRVVVGAVGFGLALVYMRDANGDWVQTQVLVPPTRPPFPGGDGFGASVEVYSDLAVVGAPNADGVAPRSGAVFAYRRLPDNTWTLDAKLVDPKGTTGAAFGSAVGMESTSVLVGSPGNDVVAGFIRGDDGAWTSLGRGVGPPEFGSSVAAGEGRGIAGSPGDGGGSAAVFGRAAAGGVQLATLVAPDGSPGNRFGAAVGISGDVAAVANGFGSVYVFDLVPVPSQQITTQVSGALSYTHVGEVVAGSVNTTRAGDRVTAVTGFARLDSDRGPVVAFLLGARPGSRDLTGLVAVVDAPNGFVHLLLVTGPVTSTGAHSETASMSGFDLFGTRGLVHLDWTIDDAATP
jgi:hypothetical protein